MEQAVYTAKLLQLRDEEKKVSEQLKPLIAYRFGVVHTALACSYWNMLNAQLVPGSLIMRKCVGSDEYHQLYSIRAVQQVDHGLHGLSVLTLPVIRMKSQNPQVQYAVHTSELSMTMMF